MSTKTIKEEVLPPKQSKSDTDKDTEKKLQELDKGNVARGSLSEDSISTEAIDFEESSFLEKNKNAGVIPGPKEDDEEDVDDYERSFIEKESERLKDENVSEEDAMDQIMHEIADQPFEVAMGNLEVDKSDLIKAAAGVFSSKGYFEQDFDLPFGSSVTMRSKTVNDYVDYTEYVRRLLLDPISQKEFDTFTQLRNLSYAVVALDGDDMSEMSANDRYDMLKETSEVKITAIINTTKSFWRIAHLLLHPGLVDFLAQSPEE